MRETKRPLKVFLCHASVDKPKVRELYRYLRKRGIKPWFDEVDLVGGQDWQVEIPKAIAASDAFIVCLTKNSVDKEGYVQKEIKFALDKALEMSEGRIYLIPVRFEECDVPFSLSRYQWVDLFEKNGFPRLMKSLKTRASQLERATVQVPKPDESSPNLASMPANNISVKVEGNIQDSTIVVGDKNVVQSSEKKVEGVHRKSPNAQVESEILKRVPAQKKEPDKKKSESQRSVTSKPRRKLNTSILVAVIGAGATILAAIIGIFPQLFKPAPVSTISASATVVFTNSLPLSTKTSRPNATPTKTRTPAPTSLPTQITDPKGVTMRLVPAGVFTKGPQGFDQEVNLETFYIDKFEVTNAKYRECVNKGACDNPTSADVGSVSYFNNKQYDDYPVVWITQETAKSYCDWRGARLPTDSEWEKAARGADGRIYPWGNSFDKNIIYANSKGIADGYETTAPVGKFSLDVSPYGVYDMAGNVSEWVDAYANFNNGFGYGDYPLSRGGSWYIPDYSHITPEYDLNVSTGDGAASLGNSSSYIGFRCVRAATP